MKVKLVCTYQRLLADLLVPQRIMGRLRRADDFIRLGVVAAAECLEQLSVKPDPEASQRCGMILGTAFGTMQTNFDVLDQIVRGEQTSPTLFSHSVFNAAAGYMSSVFDMKGCALTVTDFSLPFFRALREGWLAVDGGVLDRCLVLQVETYSALLADARHKMGPAQDWPAGVVCWLLERDHLSARSVCSIELPVVEDLLAEPMTVLHQAGSVDINGSCEELTHPLAAAMLISEQLDKAVEEDVLDCRVGESGGTASFRLTI